MGNLKSKCLVVYCDGRMLQAILGKVFVCHLCSPSMGAAIIMAGANSDGTRSAYLVIVKFSCWNSLPVTKACVTPVSHRPAHCSAKESVGSLSPPSKSALGRVFSSTAVMGLEAKLPPLVTVMPSSGITFLWEKSPLGDAKDSAPSSFSGEASPNIISRGLLESCTQSKKVKANV